MTDTETRDAAVERGAYRVTVDRDACDGIFACLVRDPRFVEDDDGLASVDPESAVSVDSDGEFVTARFADDRREEAEQAAEACPLDAIAVEAASPAEDER